MAKKLEKKEFREKKASGKIEFGIQIYPTGGSSLDMKYAEMRIIKDGKAFFSETFVGYSPLPRYMESNGEIALVNLFVALSKQARLHQGDTLAKKNNDQTTYYKVLCTRNDPHRNLFAAKSQKTSRRAYIKPIRAIY